MVVTQYITFILNDLTLFHLAASDTVRFFFFFSRRLIHSHQTISATGSFLHLMATHPEVQRRAQEEIDHVVSNDRLPDFTDRASLPYIEAVYHEVLRHSPPLPLGIAHALMEDDVYEGFFLPGGHFPFLHDWCNIDKSSFQGLRF